MDRRGSSSPQSKDSDGKQSSSSCQRRSSESSCSVISGCRSCTGHGGLVNSENDSCYAQTQMYPNAHASSSRVRLPAQQLVDETMDELLGEMEDMSFNTNPDFPDDLSDSSDPMLYSRASESDLDVDELSSQHSASSPTLCPLCKKPPDVLCATICGHLFCFECICLEFEISGVCPSCGKSGALVVMCH
ncbi:RING-type domain-containing protein [Pleurotus pulmonarius]